MAQEVTWSRPALRDLEEVRDYIARDSEYSPMSRRPPGSLRETDSSGFDQNAPGRRVYPGSARVVLVRVEAAASRFS